jgi:hypothetical protein
MQILIALPWKYHSHQAQMSSILLRLGRPGPAPDLGTVLPAGVSLLERLRKRQGERVLSPRGPTGDGAGPRYDQGQLLWR